MPLTNYHGKQTVTISYDNLFPLGGPYSLCSTNVYRPIQ